MKQSFVIFVCTFDPFHIGRHVYTFENRCVEDPNLPLNDGTQKIILNTKGIFDDVRPELKRLLNFIDGRQPEDSFTQDLSKAVESAKRNEKWRHDYMTLQMAYDEKYREGLETGIQQGIERGIEQGITTSARPWQYLCTLHFDCHEHFVLRQYQCGGCSRRLFYKGKMQDRKSVV